VDGASELHDDEYSEKSSPEEYGDGTSEGHGDGTTSKEHGGGASLEEHGGGDSLEEHGNGALTSCFLYFSWFFSRFIFSIILSSSS
jgi:hypothetical protein